MRSEAAKYSAVWEHPEYRHIAPGEFHVNNFLRLSGANSAHSICDLGCGTGRAAARIAASSGAAVCAVDFAENSLDEAVRGSLGEHLRFRRHDLFYPLNEQFDFAFCTDVLEHIPPADVNRVLINAITAARRCYFAISTVPDVMGELVGEPLHLTVESPYWWHDKLTSLGFRIDWSASDESTAVFYGSAYANGDDFNELSRLNESHERVICNIRANLALGLKEIEPHEPQPDITVMLLAGGPSLLDYESEIIERGRTGAPIVTVNGTYNWLLDRGIKPAAQVMVDAREFNRRFISRTVDTCKYLVSSQCDNDLVSSLPPAQTWLWHAGQSDLVKDAVTEWAKERGTDHQWYPVYGASTVISRAITMLAMLGFRKIEIFGWDSCIRGSEHHAYPQHENDSAQIVEVKCGDRTFRCHPWMLVQANEFPKLVKHIYSAVPDLELSVRGDGLIAAILQHSAQLENPNGS